LTWGVTDILAHATAAYRLNPEMHEFLGSGLIRLIVRGESVIGRYGRRGYLSGTLQGLVLTAALRDGVHDGELLVTFDEAFASFNGCFHAAGDGESHERPCSGMRVTRRRVYPGA
jgi:hypothetical protein